MKKIYLLIILSLFSLGIIAQTATNFNVPNCSGVNYDLFSALDAGKVVVIGWAMPCGSCVLPLKTTYNVVESYQANFPDMVEMLICDDYANTPCSSFELWVNSNGMAHTNRFSNNAIKMIDYGSVGMPKVVVVGGPDHKVYYNANDAVDHVALQQAINSAISLILGTSDRPAKNIDIRISPNPITDKALISFNLKQESEVKILVFNEKGQEISNVYAGFTAQGEQQIELNTSQFSNGIYILHLQYNEGISYQKFSVAR